MVDTRTLLLAELLAGLPVTGDVPDCRVAGLAMNTAQLEPGDAFVALAGTVAHGLDHAAAAETAGAVCILHDGRAPLPTNCRLPMLEIPELDQCLSQLASRFWGSLEDMDLIAVTGTNGKSSVAWLLAQALEGAMIGTLGIGRPGEQVAASHTTPDRLTLHRALARLRWAGEKTVVLEASSHALDQRRLADLTFSATIFTVLGHDHLDYHHDLASYGEAKARLFFDYASERCLINADDRFGRELIRRLSEHPGLRAYAVDNPDAHARVEPQAVTASGITARIVLGDQSVMCRSELIGKVNFYNLLIVAMELAARGVPIAEIGERLSRLRPVPGRMEAVCERDGVSVVVDYAHSPDALEQALLGLKEYTAGQLRCVFGCGGDRDRAKRPLMGRLAEALADRVYLTNDNPRHEDGLAIIREIQSGMNRPDRARVIVDRAEAIRAAIAEAEAGDVVLIAGKGHENYQQIGQQRLAFSDQAVARQCMEACA